ncbi:MAG: C69 family dipeptidase, partial [Spirochaetales bacterium]|nr:C69 family dipeptidase [Spirochaetales bacterium]
MCDTLVIEGAGRSVFGKNSDRDPGELQLLQYSAGDKEELLHSPCQERLPKYLEGPYKNLKAFAETWSGGIPALVSRPAWIWGAEMGVNIRGLAIGNEAVFSREKTAPGGLLGMDILRLSLHSCSSAADALRFITGLIEEYGQGGNGSYKGTLRYHNSFLIKDPGEAFILETSGRHWVSRRVSGHASISNAYTLSRDFD